MSLSTYRSLVSVPDTTPAGAGGVALTNNFKGLADYVLDSVAGLASANTFTANGAVSAPPAKLNGTWYSGGSATTTKPQLLIEPSAATSTGWSTSGTGFGVNAASGFAGNIADLQVNGVSRCKITSYGHITHVTTTGANAYAYNLNHVANSGQTQGVILASNMTPATGAFVAISNDSGGSSTVACPLAVTQRRNSQNDESTVLWLTNDGFNNAAGSNHSIKWDAIADSNGNVRSAAKINFQWATITDASRKGRVTHSVYDTAIRECLRMEASGTAAMIGFLGAAAVIQATTSGSASTFAANTSAIANDTATWDGYTIGQVVKALRNLGLLA